MSPVTPTPGLNSIPTATSKGAAGVSPFGNTVGPAPAMATTDLRTVTVPNLNPGKLIPGPDEWRALERRASSFRA